MPLSSLIQRFDRCLAEDAGMQRAMRRLPGALNTPDWPLVEQAARAETYAAIRRALGASVLECGWAARLQGWTALLRMRAGG